jgi:hypothetical protein
LTRAGKEIERILASEWSSLPAQDPVAPASFVLTFYDGGIKASHRVLGNADDLREMTAPPKDYRINESAFARALPAIGETTSQGGKQYHRVTRNHDLRLDALQAQFGH